MNDSKDHKAAAEPPLDCRVGHDSPRVEALILDVIAKNPGRSAYAQAQYYEDVHQYLAPLARELERETIILRTLATDAIKAWDNNQDARVGKLLRAMLDADFRKTYRPDTVPNACVEPGLTDTGKD